MASRDLTVRIDGDSSGLEQAAKRSARELKALEAQQAKTDRAMTNLGLVSSAAGAAVALGLGKAVSASMDFEKSLSGLKAATGANAASMDLLRAAALKVGKDTSLSATQAADAATELGKAGLSTADILGGALAGAASLAEAGQLDMAKAAEITAGSLAKFKLEGGDAAHVADLLSAGSGKALGSVEDLGMALNQSGGIAAQMGFSIDETVGALAQFAEAGYTGSDAGTSFKQMMLSFVPASEKAAEAMAEYGLEFFNANGELKSFTEIAGVLQQGLGALTAEQQASALKTIFGADAYRVAAVAMEGGAQDAAKWAAAVDDTGHAARTAATMTDNLTGDLERLGGTFETALIGSGTAANGVLREMVQLADGALGVYTDLPGPVQATATGVAALASAAALASGAFMIGAPKVAAFKSSLDDLGPRSQRVGKGILGIGTALAGPWGIALAGGVAALGLFAKAKGDAKAQVDAFTAAIEADSGAIGKNAREVAVLALEQEGVLASAEQLGLSLKDVTDAALGDAGALDRLRESQERAQQAQLDAANAQQDGALTLDEHAQAAADTAVETDVLVGRVENLAGVTEKAQAAARRNAEALGEQETATGGAAEKTTELADASKDAVEALDAQADALRAQYDPIFAMQQAVMKHAEAQQELKTAIAQKGAKSKEATDAEWAMLEATVGLSGAATTLTGAVAGNATSVEQARGQLRRWVEQGLLTQGQAEQLGNRIGGLTARADKLTDTPATVKVGEKGVQPTIAALSRLSTNVRQLDGMTATVTTVYRRINTEQGARVAGPSGSGTILAASGGYITGPGGPKDDRIPALLSNGEYVVQAAAVQRVGLPALDRLNNMANASASATLMRFASGGAVAATTTKPVAMNDAGWLTATPAGTVDARDLVELTGSWR